MSDLLTGQLPNLPTITPVNISHILCALSTGLIPNVTQKLIYIYILHTVSDFITGQLGNVSKINSVL